jgi:diguanylate cyclase (GGDEF)-like protein
MPEDCFNRADPAGCRGMAPKGAPKDEVEATTRFSMEKVMEESGETHWLEATLTVLRGPKEGTVYQLRDGKTVIGRSNDVDIQINAEGVSRRHAQISELDGAYTLEDLGSTNGTVCHGQWVEKPYELSDGDRVNLGGGVVLRFALEGELEQQLRARLYDLATRDPLTSAYNRRFLDERMNSEWPWAVRHEQSCAVLMVDIDHFKQVNDTWGHLAGDHVLKELVKLMADTIRREDLLARVGGEEFAVLCRGTGRVAAITLAERLRTEVARHEFIWNEEPISLTISVGVATSSEKAVASTDDLLALADQRLYQAKGDGRNRVEPPAT